MRTIDFYNEAKKANSLNDADMARLLGVTTAAIAHAKKANHFSAYITVRCAEIAGLDVKEAAAIAGIEAEHVPEKREYLMRKLGAIAAGAAFFGVTFFLTPTPSEAAPALKTSDQTLYIMSNRRRKYEPLFTICAWFKRLFSGTALQPAAS